MGLLKGFIAVTVMVGSFFLMTQAAWAANPDYYNSGLSAMKAGAVQEAIDHFSRAIKESPNDYRLYNDRGVAYKRLGDLERALVDYSKALEIKPDYANALNNRGLIYLQRGSYDEALQDFNEALKFGGIEGKIYTNMGLARARKGDHRSAIKDFDLAVSFRPLDYRSFLFMGESLEQIGDREKALKMYQVAMGLIREPDVISQLEKKISSLEKLQVSSNSSSSNAADQRKSVESSQGKAPLKREIILASPRVEAKTETENTKWISVAPVIENVQEIEKVNREAALRSFSNSASEIFRQGMEFVQKGDTSKALVRFEDARQLEKRNRNSLAVAWCQLSICRLYNSMGENAKASETCESALKIFNSLKAHDEVAMTLIELGNIRTASGMNEQAGILFTKAVQEAALAGRKIADPKSGTASQVTKDPNQIPNQEKPTLSAAADSEKSVPVLSLSGKEKLASMDTAHQKTQTQRPETIEPANQSKSGSKQRPVNSPEKLEAIGRGPVMWGNEGPRLQASNTVQDQNNKAIVSARLKSIESKLGPDQLLPESHSQLPSPGNKLWVAPTKEVDKIHVPDPVSGVEAMASVKNRDVHVPNKTEVSSKKDTSEASKKVSEKSINEDLAELRRLRKTGDEKQMITVLEKLSEKYSRTGSYEKALNALNISLAFREKLDFKQNEEIAFNQRGLINEKLGQLSQALEDYTRALSTSNPRSRAAEKILESKSRSLAGKIGLDVEPSMETLKTLWLARSVGDISNESKAFYNMAKLYSKAQKFNESLNYFDKSSAALATEKAKVLEKLGRFEQARKEMDQALETFKKLDYSQYLNIIRNSARPDKLSRN